MACDSFQMMKQVGGSASEEDLERVCAAMSSMNNTGQPPRRPPPPYQDRQPQEQQQQQKKTERVFVSIASGSTRHMLALRVSPLKRCGRCKAVWYCSQSCQKQAWPEHKKACDSSTAA